MENRYRLQPHGTDVQRPLLSDRSIADIILILDLGVRQVQRLCVSVARGGADGLVSRKRGRPSSRRFPDDFRRAILTLITAHYSDFGPTLASEKLEERHGIQVSNETVRKLMLQAGIWRTRAQRRPKIQHPRLRRPCFGELTQIDGSDHRWFENRAKPCVLLVFIDDATGQLVAMHFCHAKSTFEYMNATKRYLLEYGKPVAFYSDKHAVFRVNKAGGTYLRFASSRRHCGIESLDIEHLTAAQVEEFLADLERARGKWHSDAQRTPGGTAHIRAIRGK